MDIDAEIERVRKDASRRIKRLKEKKKKERESFEAEGRKRICDFIIGNDKNLQMKFVEELEKGEVLKLWAWLEKRASAEIAKLQKAPREAQAPDPGNHTGTVEPRRAENA